MPKPRRYVPLSQGPTSSLEVAGIMLAALFMLGLVGWGSGGLAGALGCVCFPGVLAVAVIWAITPRGRMSNLFLYPFTLRQRREEDRELAELCPKCGYDLRAHRPGDRCPECGTPIPSPSATMNPERSRP